MPSLSKLEIVTNPFLYALNLGPKIGRAAVLGFAAAVCLLLFFSFSPNLKTLEDSLGALGWTLNPDTTIEERMIIVAIDEKSLADVGPWPWTRPQMAQLVSALNGAGVQLQLHDVVYAEPKPGDAQLLAALEASNGAVLAQVPILQSGNSVQAQIGNLTYPITGVSCNADTTSFPSTSNYLTSTSNFSGIPKGHITPVVANDGAIRSFPAVVCIDENAYPAISISALLQATRSNNWSGELITETSFLGPDQLLRFSAYPGLEVPLDNDGNIKISYKKAPESFVALSASDVMSGNFEAALLENAWVLVGATAFGIGDIVPTPYSGATPGVEIQARILSSLLDAEIPYEPQVANGIQILTALLFAFLLFALSSTPGRWPAYGLPLAGIALPLFALAIHVVFLSTMQIWLGWLLPSLYGLLGAGMLFVLEYRRVRSERGRIFDNLSSYLPSDLANEIALELPRSGVKAKRCDVTLLNADIRNFAAFGEARPPEDSARVLDRFFSNATEIIERCGGRIYEFKGDSLLAVWDGISQHVAELAVQAANEMQDAIEMDLLETDSNSNLDPLALGIGIEQGPVLIGSIGAAHRRSAAMIGDTVTITLRIQEQTAELAQPILIGECAARQLTNVKLESQGSFLLSGLKIPHGLFALEFEGNQKASAETSYLKVVS